MQQSFPRFFQRHCSSRTLVAGQTWTGCQTQNHPLHSPWSSPPANALPLRPPHPDILSFDPRDCPARAPGYGGSLDRGSWRLRPPVRLHVLVASLAQYFCAHLLRCHRSLPLCIPSQAQDPRRMQLPPRRPMLHRIRLRYQC